MHQHHERLLGHGNFSAGRSAREVFCSDNFPRRLGVARREEIKSCRRDVELRGSNSTAGRAQPITHASSTMLFRKGIWVGVVGIIITTWESLTKADISSFSEAAASHTLRSQWPAVNPYRTISFLDPTPIPPKERMLKLPRVNPVESGASCGRFLGTGLT